MKKLNERHNQPSIFKRRVQKLDKNVSLNNKKLRRRRRTNKKRIFGQRKQQEYRKMKQHTQEQLKLKWFEQEKRTATLRVISKRSFYSSLP